VPEGWIFTELYAHDAQLETLHSLAFSAGERMVVLPGPRQVFVHLAGPSAYRLAGELLRKVRHVWAYSSEVAQFADELAEKSVATVIPWPFDYCGTRRLAGQRNSSDPTLRVLVGSPLRFGGPMHNDPRHLESALASALEDLPTHLRSRLRFYAVAYEVEDVRTWKATAYGQRAGILRCPRQEYVSFLRFLNSCAAVVNLSRASILGRICFLSAALEKPGLFTRNVEISRRLYPTSLLDDPSDPSLSARLRRLLEGLSGNQEGLNDFLPDVSAARAIGDLARNGEDLRAKLDSTVSQRGSVLTP
jgi:hypothetical protein